MIRARQIVSAIVAAAVCFAGAVAAEPAHAHGLNDHDVDSVHIRAVNADADHHSILAHDHDQSQPSGDADDQVPDHGAVFHFHSPCFVAIIAEAPVFGEVSVKPVLIAPEQVVSVMTRSTAPPDRPPRAFL